mgnify:CR=1 FL=1|jgi:hypothetical protein
MIRKLLKLMKLKEKISQKAQIRISKFLMNFLMTINFSKLLRILLMEDIKDPKQTTLGLYSNKLQK